MKEKYLINARIIDPKNQMDEIGGLIIDINGKIKAVGKKVVNGNLPTGTEKIDIKKQSSSIDELCFYISYIYLNLYQKIS